jgi:MFS family permease
MSDAPSKPSAATLQRRLLLSLILTQISVHAAMAGQRMAAPLQALEAGHQAWAVGLLLALFAALPVLTAMGAGRMADRHGYHRPVHVAVALTVLGTGLALLASWLPGWWRFAGLCIGAAASGVGTNVALIAVQRTAGQLVTDSTERLRVFSWLGMAPSLANVVGPVLAGFMIDSGGFASAYAVMMVLPFMALWFARGVPAESGRSEQRLTQRSGSMWELLQVPGMQRLLVVNWLFSASWDVHSFAVPVLGHARGYNASTIGLVLGAFTMAVTVVRFIIPMLAHRVNEVTALRSAMFLTGLVFAAYPFATSPWLMATCAVLLGLTLGSTQPMIMSTLHHLTPPSRHGEALAFRSMAINASSSVMPLAFGMAGTALGPGIMFWIMGAAVGSGSWVARGLREVFTERDQRPGPH